MPAADAAGEYVGDEPGDASSERVIDEQAYGDQAHGELGRLYPVEEGIAAPGRCDD